MRTRHVNICAGVMESGRRKRERTGGGGSGRVSLNERDVGGNQLQESKGERAILTGGLILVQSS